MTPSAGRPGAPTLLSQRHLPSLDGLRGLAILLVLPHNLVPATDVQDWFGKLVLSALDRGWIGVQLFFVLSGFLITGILLDTRRYPNGLSVFFARRVLRIFPLYYLTLLVMLVLLPAWHWPPRAPATPAPLAWSYWLYLTNWVAPWHEGQGILPHLWSLAVEEQFYLIWPFLVWHLRPRSVIVLSMGVAITALLTRAFMLSSGWPQATVYEFTICRIDALVFGAAAAAALRERQLARLFDRPGRLGWAALGVGLAGTLVSHAYQPYGPGAQTVGYLMLSIAFALWILGLACRELSTTPADPPLRGQGWLRWTWLRRCGRYSYAMYLLHVPLAVAIGRPLLALLRPDHAARSALQPGALSALYVAGMMLLTYGLAWCSYHGLERHLLARKPRYAETVLTPTPAWAGDRTP